MNKQLITSILAVFLSVATAFGSASEPTIISKGKTFVIDSKIWKTETVNLSITDDEGNLIFSAEHFVSTSRKYSLENLPSGNYEVTVSNDYKAVINDININAEDISVDFASKIVYKPVMNITDKNIDINFLANGETEMYIYKDSETVYNNIISKERSINKRFDISNLESGLYTVVITNDNNTYSKVFNKK